MIDLVSELRSQSRPHNYIADLTTRAADEIERLRNLVRAAGVTCEQCGDDATFADPDDWAFCSDSCMKAMEAEVLPTADDVRGIFNAHNQERAT